MKRRGEVTAVKDLFEKYKKTLQAPQKTVELEAIRVIGELTNITIKEHQVAYTVSTRTLSIQVPSLIKQELKKRFPEILNEIKARLGDKSAPYLIL
jgi:predicted metal-dependent hydrolase